MVPNLVRNVYDVWVKFAQSVRNSIFVWSVTIIHLTDTNEVLKKNKIALGFFRSFQSSRERQITILVVFFSSTMVRFYSLSEKRRDRKKTYGKELAWFVTLTRLNVAHIGAHKMFPKPFRKPFEVNFFLVLASIIFMFVSCILFYARFGIRSVGAYRLSVVRLKLFFCHLWNFSCTVGSLAS